MVASVAHVLNFLSYSPVQIAALDSSVVCITTGDADSGHFGLQAMDDVVWCVCSGSVFGLIMT